MGRRTFGDHPQRVSTALPFGGRTGELAGEMTGSASRARVTEQKGVWTRGGPKLVDDTTTSVDRHKTHIVRQERPDSHKMFEPLSREENYTCPVRGALAGKHLHADPFSAERPQLQPRRSRFKVNTPRGKGDSNRRLLKSAPPPQESLKPGFISANGVRHIGSKRVPAEKFSVTHDKPQPPRDYTSAPRFHHSPDKRTSAIESATTSNQGSVPRKISNALQDDVAMLAGEQPLAIEQPRRARKIQEDRLKITTMEGVMGIPMRDGHTVRPTATAPWNQETINPVAGKRAITQRPSTTHSTPYAVEW